VQRRLVRWLFLQKHSGRAFAPSWKSEWLDDATLKDASEGTRGEEIARNSRLVKERTKVEIFEISKPSYATCASQ